MAMEEACMEATHTDTPLEESEGNPQGMHLAERAVRRVILNRPSLYPLTTIILAYLRH
ncbi:hypothetical protein GQ55_3G060700 [Panicum hallii var. hallii]|uniref:Uncharacterized protein n=1 Tax=Panicum hallii var. hallii TaxID=1504633 RepID=A0A2T7E690_9POAL|nr:hypothetical protein GQ55_3G060700 [Panicum hallii var. hallii]